jgi:hypothetical protein
VSRLSHASRDSACRTCHRSARRIADARRYTVAWCTIADSWGKPATDQCANSESGHDPEAHLQSRTATFAEAGSIAQPYTKPKTQPDTKPDTKPDT